MRAASSAPQRSTAALSVVGDSRRTSVSMVSTSHGCSRRQKSRRLIIGGMIAPRTHRKEQRSQRTSRRYAGLCALCTWWPILCVLVSAQVPQPFPRPGQPPQPRPAQPAPSQPPPAVPPPPAAPPPAVPPPPAVSAPAPAVAPTAENLGVPIFPGAQFIASYDA